MTCRARPTTWPEPRCNYDQMGQLEFISCTASDTQQHMQCTVVFPCASRNQSSCTHLARVECALNLFLTSLPSGRALLKSKQQKRNKKRTKGHSTPNQKRKQLALAKKEAKLRENAAEPETPRQQLCPGSETFSKVLGASESE